MSAEMMPKGGSRDDSDKVCCLECESAWVRANPPCRFCGNTGWLLPEYTEGWVYGKLPFGGGLPTRPFFAGTA